MPAKQMFTGRHLVVPTLVSKSFITCLRFLRVTPTFRLLTDCQGRFGALVSLALDCCEEFVASAPPHTWLTDVEFGFDHGTLAYSDELPLCRWCRQRHVRKFYIILRRFARKFNQKLYCWASRCLRGRSQIITMCTGFVFKNSDNVAVGDHFSATVKLYGGTYTQFGPLIQAVWLGGLVLRRRRP